jgi:thiosulfate dehydrogenase (quinone) large subunit
LAQGTVKRPPGNRPPPYNNPIPPQQQPRPIGPPQPAREPSPVSSIFSSALVPGWIILPLRLFLGISFLSAGWDKLTDPTYLNPASASSIGAQISRFAPGTPLEGFLLNFAVPNATLFGVMVMGGELCIGAAVLLGLLTRFSAAMGLFLNLTFFLSATWNIHPFYFGADLPYVFGWLTLVLAGPGPFALDARLKEWLTPAPISYVSRGKVVTVDDTSAAMTRRAFVGAGAAGLAGFVLAATGISWGIINSGKRGNVATVPPATQPTQAPTIVPPTTNQGGGLTNPNAQQQPNSPPAVPTPTTASAASGLTKLAGPSDVPVNQSLDFSLPTGDPAVLVHTDSGYSAYVAICTHQGCQVSYFPQYKIIGCPCHGAEFDAANNGQVLRGPARSPLSAVPITVGPDGSVYLSA